MAVGWLSHWMLQSMRAFVIEHKGIFEKAIIAYAKILPEPTKENTLEPNSHILLDRKDKFFGYYCNSSKMALFEAIWKIRICEYEHDPHYRHISDWDAEEQTESMLSGEWKPRPTNHPSGGWNEPHPYGGYVNRSFKNLIKS